MCAVLLFARWGGCWFCLVVLVGCLLVCGRGWLVVRCRGSEGLVVGLLWVFSGLFVGLRQGLVGGAL